MERAVFYFVIMKISERFAKTKCSCVDNVISTKKRNKTQINQYKLQKFEVDKVLIRKGGGGETKN